MEKFIKLLDEFDHKKTEDLERWKKRVEENKHRIISKQFCFIWWLLKNDKIDMDKVDMFWHITNTYDLDEPWEPYWDEKRITMLLSIQEYPIEFLISILKNENKKD